MIKHGVKGALTLAICLSFLFNKAVLAEEAQIADNETLGALEIQ